MEAIVIKPAEIGHIPLIETLYSEYATKTLCRAEMEKILTLWPAAVVFSGSQAVGFGYSAPFAPDILELRNLFVKRSHRSKGIGEMLLRFIEDLCRSKFSGIVLVNSLTHETLEKKRFAKSFYLRNGYQLILTTGKSDLYGKTW